MRARGLAVLVLSAGISLAGCGGDGGTTGTNYSDPPPMAEIVATPSESPSPTPTPTPSPSPSEAMTMVDPATGLPADVTAFKEKRDACEHWMGEEGTDEDRQQEIADGIAENCTGTDAALTALKEKYAGNDAVQRALADYESEIE